MPNALIEDIRYCSDILDFAPHTHNCYEIIYLQEGALHVCIGNREYDAVSPALIFVSKLEQHSLTVTGSAYKRYYMCISPMDAGNFIRSEMLLTVLSNRPADFCHVLDVSGCKDEIDRIFRTCAEENISRGPYFTEKQAVLLYELLILIYREKPSIFSAENNKSVAVIWKIQCRFEQSCGDTYSLASLATEYHMSPSYLSHLFKHVTGYAIMQYLTMCRLSAARQLLRETSMTVTEIVYATGFSDSSNFSRLFKRENGCSPLEYRKMHGNP